LIELTYGDLVREWLRLGRIYANKKSPHMITHQNTDVVLTRPVCKGETGEVLKITCPDNKAITICGRNHYTIDYPPHFFSLGCRSNDDQNLSPDTIFTITKYGGSGVIPLFCKNGDCPILYSELSQTVGERFKRKEERHYFPMGIILYSGETLVFRVSEPDIDIVKTELLMQADIWERGV